MMPPIVVTRPTPPRLHCLSVCRKNIEIRKPIAPRTPASRKLWIASSESDGTPFGRPRHVPNSAP